MKKTIETQNKYSTKVDRVREPMHQCIEDETLKERIFLVFGQTWTTIGPALVLSSTDLYVCEESFSG